MMSYFQANFQICTSRIFSSFNYPLIKYINIQNHICVQTFHVKLIGAPNYMELIGIKSVLLGLLAGDSLPFVISCQAFFWVYALCD